VGDPVEPSPKAFDAAPPHIQAAIRAYAAFNARDLDAAVPELDEARACITRAALQARIARLLKAFPDLLVSHLRAYDLTGGRVAVRYVISGTNQGALADERVATGRRIQIEVVDTLEFDDAGRLAGGARNASYADADRQLGLIDG